MTLFLFACMCLFGFKTPVSILYVCKSDIQTRNIPSISYVTEL